MVVVLGTPRPLRRPRRAVLGPAGRATRVALAVAEAGAAVELVGKAGDDAAGDALVVELERAGIGHAALLRDPGARTVVAPAGVPPPLERADVELAFGYLIDPRVVVVAESLSADLRAAVDEAIGYSGAHLVLVADAAAGASGPDAARTTVLQPPAGEGEGFARLVGRYAARLDAGEAPGAAFAAALAEVGGAETGTRGGAAR